MAQKKSKKSTLASHKIGIGVGLTAAAVAAAGSYFLYGSPNAAKNRKKVKSWMLKAKAEVLEALEGAEEMTKEEYEDLVEGIAGAYASLKSASRSEIQEFKNEMKKHWKNIEKSGVVKRVKTTAKKSVKKKTAPKKKASKKTTARKTSKKTAKKASTKRKK